MNLCYPVNYVYITNGFKESHQAVDLGWRDNPNVPIYACANGIVTRSFFDDLGGGLTLTVKYDNGYTSVFKHLSKILVKVNQKVSQLEQVAVMGNTGWDSTGPHLHFSLSINNEKVNPLDYCYLYPSQKVAEKDKNKVKYYEEDRKMKFKIGDRVIVSGNLYTSSNSTKSTSKIENKVTTITRVASGSLHPYNTTGDLGWMDEKDIKMYEETTDYKTLYENELNKNKELQNQLNRANEKIEQIKKIIN